MPKDPNFVSYATALYHYPEVEQACIMAQDVHGLDVNMILLCAWSGFCRRYLLSEREIALLSEVSVLWQHSMIQQLRSGRRWLKSQKMRGAEALRERLLAIEVEAERLEQVQLEEAFENIRTAGCDSGKEISLVRKNLELYSRAFAVDTFQNEILIESIIIGCEGVQNYPMF